MRSSRLSPLSVQLFILDILCTLFALYLSSILRNVVPLGTGGLLPRALTEVPWQVYLFAVICWPLALVNARTYDPERVLRWYGEALHVLGGGLAASALMAGLLYMSFRELSRLQFIYFTLVNLVLMLSYRALMRVYYRAVGRRRPGGRSRTLILGAGELGQRAAKVLLDHSRWGHDLVGFLDDDPDQWGKLYEGFPVLGNIDRLVETVGERGVEEVWITLPAHAHDRVKWSVTQLERLPVRIKVVPDYYNLALITARPEIVGGIPLIGLREPVIEGTPRVIKRLFDLTLTLLMLIPLAPLMGLIALIIRLDSPGPVLFRQTRVGENGRLFQMLKFRTMRADAEAHQEEVIQETPDGAIIHKRPDDPRVTRVGRFLRRYSLDELPQLFNVLKGEMSLVGPRPELPWLVDRYDSWQRKRFAVPQGITGWWQINGRSDKPMHLHTEDDLYYVYNYSLWLDILILLRTPIAVIQGKGAF